MSQIAYYVISFMVGFLSVLLLSIAFDDLTRPSPKSRKARKERKWITIDTSGEASDQEDVTSVNGREQELTRKMSSSTQESSRAGHVNLDFTSALRRKRRRGG